MNTSSTNGRDPLELLAEEFAERRQRGESPSIGEYEARYPDLADKIRHLFPALVLIEDVGQASADPSGALPLPDADRRLPLLGDYRLNRIIGRGGMGVVYEAEQVSLGRLVAVKVLPRDISDDPRRLLRFEREARAAGRLHHTNIVPVLGVGHHEGTHFYVMQLIGGQGLDLVIEELKPLRRQPASRDAASPPAVALPVPTGSQVAHKAGAGPPSQTAASVALALARGRFDPAPAASLEAPAETLAEPTAGVVEDVTGIALTREFGPSASADAAQAAHPQADSHVNPSSSSSLGDLNLHFWDSVARIGLQVAEALEYAHAQGVIHRDIKPSNLLLDLQGVVWVTDFGLAHSNDADDLSQPRDLIGTIRYMPPERFEGHRGDARSDLYSLGLTLYELLALRPAFASSNQRQLVRQVVEETPTRLHQLDPSLPRGLEAIVQKAIEREPAHRYATAEELAADLRRFLERRPIRARRTPWPERFALWCRRNPSLAAMTTVAAALTVSIAVISSVAAFRLRSQRDAERRTARTLKLQEARLQRSEAAERAQRERADQALYTSNMRLVQQLYEGDGTAAAISELLSEHIPRAPNGRDLRDFGWRFQWTRLNHSAANSFVPAGPRSGVLSAASELVTLDPRGRWARVDLKTGQVMAEGDFGRPWAPRCTALSPTGMIAARGENLSRTFRLFELSTGRERLAIEGPVPVDHIEFSPDGRQILSLWSDHTARVHEVDGGRLLGSVRLLPGPYFDATLTLDAEDVVLANHPSSGEVTSYKVKTGEFKRVRLASTIHMLASSPVGRQVVCSNFRGDLFLSGPEGWKAMTGQREHRGSVRELAFSADGRLLASGGEDGLVVVWDVVAGTARARLKGHLGMIETISFSPHASTLVTGDHRGCLKLWELRKPDGATTVDMPGEGVQGLTFTPDGLQMIVTGNTVRAWDLAGPTPIQTFPVQTEADRIETRGRTVPTSVAISRDGSRLAIGDSDSQITVRDRATGAILHTLEGVAPAFYGAPSRSEALATPGRKRAVAALDFSPDGTLLAAGFGLSKLSNIKNYKQYIKIYDVLAGREVQQMLVNNSVSMVRFTRDGRTLIATGHDRSVRFWDVPGWRPDSRTLRTSHGIMCAMLSPDEDLLVAGDQEGSIIVWDWADRRELRRVHAHSEMINGIAVSSDGKTIAALSTGEAALTLWDARDLRELYRERSQLKLRSVAFSQDGGRLIVSYPNGMLFYPALGLAEIDRARIADAARIQRHGRVPPSRPAVPVPGHSPTIDGSRLQACSGRYRRETDPLLIVTFTGTGLVVTGPRGGRYDLVPESAASFVHPQSGARFRFDTNDAGEVVKLDVCQDGSTFEVPRISSPIAPGPVQP